MPDQNKQIFLSYRRTNLPWAIAIDQNLRAHGYDVFLDMNSIPSGDFERIILGQIAARPHFVVLLTPSALERCNEPNDWLRKEIEYAIKMQRNIVPLFFEGFSFRDVIKYLTGDLSLLQNYNGMTVPSDYFQEAMERLRDRYLSSTLDAIIHPAPPADAEAIRLAQEYAASQPTPTEVQLNASEWFERGNKEAVLRKKLNYYDEAIKLEPAFFEAYNNRGIVRYKLKDFHGSLEDYNQAIRLRSDVPVTYNNRGNAYRMIDDNLSAIKDYDQAIRLNPHYANAYYHRGLAYENMDDHKSAVADYTQAIKKRPDHVAAYTNRGFAYVKLKNYRSAIADYSRVIQLQPTFAGAYRNRGIAYEGLGDLLRANEDYARYIELKGIASATVQKWIQENKKKLMS